MELRGFTKVGRHPRHFKIDPTGECSLFKRLVEITKKLLCGSAEVVR